MSKLPTLNSRQKVESMIQIDRLQKNDLYIATRIKIRTRRHCEVARAIRNLEKS